MLPALFPAVPAIAANQNRITANITNSSRAELGDSVQPRARIAADQGPAPNEMKLTGLSLRFSMTDVQSAALDQLLADQQNPASPHYHQWLTPAEFGAQFGLSQADIAKVTAWLTAQGFTVTGVANSGTFVTFDGTVAQADAAFGTSIHNLLSNNEQHFANVTNATVPVALANVVGGITGLHNFRPHARLGMVAHPRFTSSVSGSHYVAPGDFYAIYDMEPLLSGGFNGAGIGTGANCHSVGGVTCGDIAVLGQVDLYNNGTSDVLAFRQAAGLSTSNLPVTVHEGGDPGQAQTCTNCFPDVNDLQEASLDVEWAGAMAPGASILFVNGPDVMINAMTQAIDLNLAPIITTSYGGCETAWGSTELNSYNQLFKQAAAQGQTVLSSSGDSGATDCDAAAPAMEGLAVDFPASSPYVTAMGGSMFNEGSATGATTYWLGTDTTTFSAGSAVPAADISARGYIPEAVWNEDSSSTGLSSTGGGVSAFFSKPAWQAETGVPGMTTTVPADSSRDLPDLSLNAAAGHDAMLFCVQNSCVSGFRASVGGGLTVAGGTSFDSQAFGGMLALIEQKVGPALPNGPRLGMVNPVLYALGN
ncbi:MAG TPA: S53 family peptidase, partial [Acidobacteriaceae bacterium]